MDSLDQEMLALIRSTSDPLLAFKIATEVLLGVLSTTAPTPADEAQKTA